jgi:type IV secretory pathway TraG/TraD family ATPase VirD4
MVLLPIKSDISQLIKTPDLSRGQKVAVIFIVQALSQPVEVYGAEITKTLMLFNIKIRS